MVDIVVLDIPPKRDTHRHHRIQYTLTFVPSTRQWTWDFTVTTITRYRGIEPSYELAQAMARQTIETVMGASDEC